MLKQSTDLPTRRRLAGQNQSAQGGTSPAKLSERAAVLVRGFEEDTTNMYSYEWHIYAMLEDTGYSAEEGSMVCWSDIGPGLQGCGVRGGRCACALLVSPQDSIAKQWYPLAKFLFHCRQATLALESLEERNLAVTIGSFRWIEGLTPDLFDDVLAYLCSSAATVPGLKIFARRLRKKMLWRWHILNPKNGTHVHETRRMPPPLCRRHFAAATYLGRICLESR